MTPEEMGDKAYDDCVAVNWKGVDPKEFEFAQKSVLASVIRTAENDALERAAKVIEIDENNLDEDAEVTVLYHTMSICRTIRALKSATA